MSSELPDSPKKVSQNTENRVYLPEAFRQRLLVFIASSNNHLMNVPVSGDDILASASIMLEAEKLTKELKIL